MPAPLPSSSPLIGHLAGQVLREIGLSGEWKVMAGYEDLNFKLSSAEGDWVVKVHPNPQFPEEIEAECQVLQELQNGPLRECLPAPRATHRGHLCWWTQLPDGQKALLRVLSYQEGSFFGDHSPNEKLAEALGRFLASLDQQLKTISHPALRARRIRWNLLEADRLQQELPLLDNPSQRRLVHHFLLQFAREALPLLADLPRQLIHNDANEWNLLTNGEKIQGIIDFGDMVHAPRIQEVAVALTYLMMQSEAPYRDAAAFLKGYESLLSVSEDEKDLLFHLVGARLCTSVLTSTGHRQAGTLTDYIGVSEQGAWKMLEWLLSTGPVAFRKGISAKVDSTSYETGTLLDHRNAHFSKSMSISYRTPLLMRSAAFQYMYDARGDSYLDCVNNIMHVGHCHPKVVEAATAQLSRLNTNTRYLYPLLTRYAETLLGHFPKRLNKLFLVNSGSAAADLALRLARAHTGRKEVLVMEHGYHGNTGDTIEISHYKYAGKGGQGASGHVFEAPLPQPHAPAPPVNVPQWTGKPVGAFIAESIVGCGGQAVFPEGYLNQIYQQVRAQGGVCIADEVQTGFGRMGSHFWAYEWYGLEPDIVVLGKPMGNGHPMAGVVTTSEIASSFETGMEFFSSFGGNPVSCAIGLAVLEVIREEGLQEHAGQVGRHFKKSLQELARQFPVLREVRGEGLFLGIEFADPETGHPATGKAVTMVNALRSRHILLSTDGPANNVIKIKPPLPFSRENADQVVEAMHHFLKNDSQTGS